MGFLKSSIFLVLLFFLSATAKADFTGWQFDTQLGAGPSDSYSLGGGAKIKFDTADFHFDYLKDYARANPTDPLSTIQGTDNWSGGLSEQASDRLSLGLDYDELSDPSDALAIDGIKLTSSFDPFELSFREARAVIDESLTFLGHTYEGAFIYQSTIEGSINFDLGENDFLSPSYSYSFFTPDLANFQKLLQLKQTKRSNLSFISSNFQGTLQTFEKWAAKVLYVHDYSETWSGILTLTVADLILDLNPMVDVNPAVDHHWTNTFSTQLGFDYLYVPGSPTWTILLELKFKFRKPKIKEPDENVSSGSSL